MEAREAARGGRSAGWRGPHSTDNVTFFNPRFTLFVLASAAGKAPKQLTSTSVPREHVSGVRLAGVSIGAEHLLHPQRREVDVRISGPPPCWNEQG